MKLLILKLRPKYVINSILKTDTSWDYTYTVYIITTSGK